MTARLKAQAQAQAQQAKSIQPKQKQKPKPIKAHVHEQAKPPQHQQQPTKEKIKPQVQAKTTPSDPGARLVSDVTDEYRRNLAERRKASMADAKNDVKKAYNFIKNIVEAIATLLKKIVNAITKAPEQEKKLSVQDKQIIEQAAEQIAKPDATTEEIFAHTGTILNQLENPSEPEAGVTQEAAAPEQGWLGRALNTVKSALTVASNTLGFKSAKEDLQQTIMSMDASDTHDTSNEQEKPKVSKDNEQEPESPGSGFQ